MVYLLLFGRNIYTLRRACWKDSVGQRCFYTEEYQAMVDLEYSAN